MLEKESLMACSFLRDLWDQKHENNFVWPDAKHWLHVLSIFM